MFYAWHLFSKALQQCAVSFNIPVARLAKKTYVSLKYSKNMSNVGKAVRGRPVLLHMNGIVWKGVKESFVTCLPSGVCFLCVLEINSLSALSPSSNFYFLPCVLLEKGIRGKVITSCSTRFLKSTHTCQWSCLSCPYTTNQVSNSLALLPLFKDFC